MIKDFFASLISRFLSCMFQSTEDNRGIGVVEVILILVVLIGLVVIFRDQLTGLVTGIFGRITEDANAL